MRSNEQKMSRYYGLPSSPSRRDRPDTKGSFSSIPKGLVRRWSVDEPPARQALVSEGELEMDRKLVYGSTWRKPEEFKGPGEEEGHLDVDGERRTSSLMIFI
ncbi:unnamed protein product [Caenorhabditis nigoni]